MFLNGDVVELDLMKNYEGNEVTFVDNRNKTTCSDRRIIRPKQLLQTS